MIARAYLMHPYDDHWIDEEVKIWAKAHPKNIKRGESATEWQVLEEAHKQEVRDQINKAKQHSQAFWDYTNKYYETLFGEPNKVKK